MILWLERKNNIDHDLVTRKKWYWSWFSQRLERNNDIDHDLVTGEKYEYWLWFSDQKEIIILIMI